jgi:hypothetical protein
VQENSIIRRTYNSYGNIKGTALAKEIYKRYKFWCTSDSRILEGHFNGNGFSYAYEEVFLKVLPSHLGYIVHVQKCIDVIKNGGSSIYKH